MCKSWGMIHKVALWMYKTVLYPQILYVSMTCCPVVSRMEATNLLRSLQSSYLRAAVGSAYETYTYKALEVVLSLAPQYLSMEQLDSLQIGMSERMWECRVRTYES